MKFVLIMLSLGGVDTATFDSERACTSVQDRFKTEEAICAGLGLPKKGIPPVSLFFDTGKPIAFANEPACRLAEQWFVMNDKVQSLPECRRSK